MRPAAPKNEQSVAEQDKFNCHQAFEAWKGLEEVKFAEIDWESFADRVDTGHTQPRPDNLQCESATQDQAIAARDL